MDKRNEINDGVGIIPKGTTVIVEGAFENCKELRNIVIPDSVKIIRERAFYGCTGLSEISIPRSVERIERLAFYGCVNLNVIHFDKAIQVIECNGRAWSMPEYKPFASIRKNLVDADYFDSFNLCEDERGSDPWR